ncbi:unnamed protein product, partial [Ectocarpus sp. 8 AP-2014]
FRSGGEGVFARLRQLCIGIERVAHLEESKSKVIPIFLETARLQGQRTENV